MGSTQEALAWFWVALSLTLSLSLPLSLGWGYEVGSVGRKCRQFVRIYTKTQRPLWATNDAFFFYSGAVDGGGEWHTRKGSRG